VMKFMSGNRIREKTAPPRRGEILKTDEPLISPARHAKVQLNFPSFIP